MLPGVVRDDGMPSYQRIRYESRDGILHVGNWYRVPIAFTEVEAETAGTYELTIDHPSI